MIKSFFNFIRNIVTTVVTIASLGITGFLAGAVYVILNSERYDSLVNVVDVAMNGGKVKEVKEEKRSPFKKKTIIKGFAKDSDT